MYSFVNRQFFPVTSAPVFFLKDVVLRTLLKQAVVFGERWFAKRSGLVPFCCAQEEPLPPSLAEVNNSCISLLFLLRFFFVFFLDPPEKLLTSARRICLVQTTPPERF